MTVPTADVPCNGCTACCREQMVTLDPKLGDNLEVLARHFDLGGTLILDSKENGDCVYLEGGGCSVWEHRPAMCRAFDCRKHFQSFSRTERRLMVKSGIASREVFEAGRERLHTLEPAASEECAAVAAAVAGGKVRRFAPGEREVELVDLARQKRASTSKGLCTGS